MADDLSRLAESVLGKDGAQAISSNGDRLRSLADSGDGRKVRAILEEKGSLEEALRRGDTQTLRDALSSVLSTDEGRRLTSQLQALLGK